MNYTNYYTQLATYITYILGNNGNIILVRFLISFPLNAFQKWMTAYFQKEQILHLTPATNMKISSDDMNIIILFDYVAVLNAYMLTDKELPSHIIDYFEDSIINTKNLKNSMYGFLFLATMWNIAFTVT